MNHFALPRALSMAAMFIAALPVFGADRAKSDSARTSVTADWRTLPGRRIPGRGFASRFPMPRSALPAI